MLSGGQREQTVAICVYWLRRCALIRVRLRRCTAACCAVVPCCTCLELQRHLSRQAQLHHQSRVVQFVIGYGVSYKRFHLHNMALLARVAFEIAWAAIAFEIAWRLALLCHNALGTMQMELQALNS